MDYWTFRNFLEDRGCMKEFEEAFISQHPGYRLDKTLWNIFGGDEFFFGRAFDWAKTKEGREFWSKIDRDWYRVATGTRSCKS